MKTVTVIAHWGPVQPTVELAASIDAGPSADRYLLLNNYVKISDAAVVACLDLLCADDVGVVGPTLVNGAGIQSTGARLSRVLAAPRAVADGATAQAHDAHWVTGAVMFVKARCHEAVPIDGRFFLAFEDVDFCTRVRQAGWRVVAAPVFAWHTGGSTIPAASYGLYVYGFPVQRLATLYSLYRYGAPAYVAATSAVTGHARGRKLAGRRTAGATTEIVVTPPGGAAPSAGPGTGGRPAVTSGRVPEPRPAAAGTSHDPVR